jgi:diguanylate cyclase (GGDEF)-like protein
VKKVIYENYHEFFKISVVLFLIFCLINSVVALAFEYQLNEKEKESIIDKEEITIDAEKSAIHNKLNKITSDLLYISDNLKMHDNGLDDFSEIEDDWVAFSNRKKIYDQIRYIDENGYEKIRVDYDGNTAVVVPKDALQDKSDRYYFIDTIGMKNDEIYISPLDLNVEGNTIEIPLMPMLRIAKPYFNDAGTLKGIIIINYAANDVLKQVASIATLSSGSISLLNSEGYWLYNHTDSNLEWSFMFEEREDDKFPNIYPKTWATIGNSNSGFISNDEGFFVYSKVINRQSFSIDNADYTLVMGVTDWILVCVLDSQSKDCIFMDSPLALLDNVIEKYFYIYVVAFIFAILIALIYVMNKSEKEHYRYFSEYDSMTGVYNRRAGFEKIGTIFEKHSKDNLKSSLCFTDINGLKEVNDNLGHEAGDELIRSVVKVIKDNISEKDFIARLGGDEFLIIFVDSDLDETEMIWYKIVSEFDRINHQEGRRYLISVSHGVEEIEYSAKNYIDIVINKADEKMYEEKRKIKKGLKIIKA